VNLITLGIGAVIGAGIFVLTGQAAALYAGPAVALSFVLAGLTCAFAGLCYSEFASIIPLPIGVHLWIRHNWRAGGVDHRLDWCWSTRLARRPWRRVAAFEQPVAAGGHRDSAATDGDSRHSLVKYHGMWADSIASTGSERRRVAACDGILQLELPYWE